MKVQIIPKETRVALANIVEQIDEWKALKDFAIMRQDELMKLIASDTTCTLEELRINQGRLLEVKNMIERITQVHAHEQKNLK